MPPAEPWNEKWEKLEELGKGGQGYTFRAKAKNNPDKLVVLKLLRNTKSAQARGRMAREVVNLAIVRQAGGQVPHLLDHNATTDNVADMRLPLYLAMELVEGDILRQLVVARKTLPLSEAVSIAVNLCATIKLAHGSGVLHRDLKPENIVVKADGSAFILDYGLSFNCQAEDSDDLTKTEEMFRNNFLQLPEHSWGQDRGDPRSDLTAVAGILFFCLTGAAPGVLRDHQSRLPHEANPEAIKPVNALNATTSHQIKTFFARAFAWELDSRFQTIEEMIMRLNELGKDESQPAADDPIAAAVRAKALLHSKSRLTILAEFRSRAGKAQAAIDPILNTLAQELRKNEVNVTQIGLTPTPLSPGVELLFSGQIIAVGLKNHNAQKAIQIIIGAAGNECVVYRAFYEFQANQWRPTNTQEMLKYAGTDDPPISLITSDLRKQIAKIIDALVELALKY